jgi:hypothetical protein
VKYFPLTLPSPARGEGKYIGIEKKHPPPRRGRDRVGVKKGFFHTFEVGVRVIRMGKSKIFVFSSFSPRRSPARGEGVSGRKANKGFSLCFLSPPRAGEEGKTEDYKDNP